MDSWLLRTVPNTPLAVGLMTIPAVAGLGVLLFALSRSAAFLEQHNARLAEAERFAAASAAELETVLESMTSPVLVHDRQGCLVRSNRAAEQFAGQRWLGHSFADLRQADGSQLFCREDGRPFAQGEWPHERSLMGETIENETLLVKRENAEPVFFLASAAPIRNARTGEIAGSVIAMRDISSLKRLDRLKDEFLFTASHELRTPLAVIRGYAELSAAALKKEQRDGRRVGDETTDLALSRIVTEVDGMASLLEQMLQIARIDSERVQLNLTAQDIVELAMAEIALLSVKPEYARVVLDREEKAQRALCRLDRVAFRQILANLVSNAIKYSPDGSPVVVRVSAKPGEGVLSVIDQGSGIPEDEIPLIFEKFYRSPNAIQSGSPGLGLGLYITGRLVELMAGRINVESRPGEGTAFHVVFPLSKRSA